MVMFHFVMFISPTCTIYNILSYSFEKIKKKIPDSRFPHRERSTVSHIQRGCDQRMLKSVFIRVSLKKTFSFQFDFYFEPQRFFVLSYAMYTVHCACIRLRLVLVNQIHSGIKSKQVGNSFGK